MGRLWGNGAVGRLRGPAAGRLWDGCGTAAGLDTKTAGFAQGDFGPGGGTLRPLRGCARSSKINWFINPPYPTHSVIFPSWQCWCPTKHGTSFDNQQSASRHGASHAHKQGNDECEHSWATQVSPRVTGQFQPFHLSIGWLFSGCSC